MMKHLPETKSSQFSLLPIIIGNIIPLIGVIFFGWELGQVVILYWIENLIIGFWNIPRILWAGESSLKSKLPMAMFFTVHYGIFCLVHGMFIMGMLSFSKGSIAPGSDSIFYFLTKGVAIGAITMFFSIGWDFYQTYIKSGDHKNWDVSHAMSHPYGHIIVIHMAIIFTGFITFLLGSPILLLILLIIGKIILEYYTKSGKFKLGKRSSRKTKTHR